MNIRIAAINFRYNAENNVESVFVRYEGFNDDHTIVNNGQVTLAKSEYEMNKSLDDLVSVVRERLANELKG